MKRLALFILGSLVLTGCSELQVIGKATFRELGADAISVEKQRYLARKARPTTPSGSRTMLAQVAEPQAPVSRPAEGARRELWVRQ
ncbi:MAG: hypothetical protein HZC44_09695 [Geobacter sp.]|nr:hypothetical protein [Geobacter sp.]